MLKYIYNVYKDENDLEISTNSKDFIREYYDIQCYNMRIIDSLRDKEPYWEIYFEDDGSRFRLSNKQYQNIFHNLIKKNADDFDKIALKYNNKAKLSRFFQNTNFSSL
ncbi:hypothetical protein LCGC14_1673390 [marine sediment metagenome]|uniref:Uncharacterized protein n=1 Tax=marine sediment metagenome TaxID=412755 RepID=A0A0F9HQN3_9ZZZZ